MEERTHIIPNSLSEKLGNEHQVRRVVSEMIQVLLANSKNQMFDSYTPSDLEDIYMKIIKLALKHQIHIQQSPTNNNNNNNNQEWEQLRLFSAMDIFESKCAFISILRKHAAFYSEAFCFEFVEQLEKIRLNLTHCLSLYRFESDEQFLKSLRDYFPKIQLVQKLYSTERDAVISCLISYVFSSRVSSYQVIATFQQNTLPLTLPLLGEFREIILHHLRLESEYTENPEYAFTFEYKFEKLIWIIDSHPLTPLTRVCPLLEFFRLFQVNIEDQIRKKHKFFSLDIEDMRTTSHLFTLIESYFGEYDTFHVKDALYAFQLTNEEDENKLLSFWLTNFKHTLSSLTELLPPAATRIYTYIESLLRSRPTLKP